MQDVVIVAATRKPPLAGLRAVRQLFPRTKLGATVIRALLKKNRIEIPGQWFDEVISRPVSSPQAAGPESSARQAAITRVGPALLVPALNLKQGLWLRAQGACTWCSGDPRGDARSCISLAA